MEKRIELERRGKSPSEIKELVLDGCKSTQIVGLTDEFANLESLSLTEVGLTSLKGFPKLPNLKRLELSENRISSSLSFLTGSPNLTVLNLGGNKIATLDELEPLKELKNLKYLDLLSCDVASVDGYREKVFALLPDLQYLDGFDRNEKEVDELDEENGTSSKYVDGDSDLDEDEDEDGEEDDDDDEDEEEEEVGLAYLQNNSIDEESEGEDYEPEGKVENDSDVEIDEDDDEDDDAKDAPRGQKRKLESDE